MATLTLTLVVPDSHATMLEKLDMTATQVDPFSLQNLLAEVFNGTQISTTTVDLDGSPVVVIPK